MPDSTTPDHAKHRRHEVLDAQGRPSEGEDEGGHEVLDATGRPSQAEGEDED